MFPNDKIMQMFLQMAQMKKTEDDAMGREMIDNTLGKIQTGAALGGGLLSATANLPGREPSMGGNIVGGALSGLSSFGIPGLFLGGMGGLLTGAKNMEGYLTGLNQEQAMNMASKTVQPRSFQEGGTAESVTIQTEKGEVMFLPETLELVKVAAAEKHKNMDPSKITDIVPEGTEVFSKERTFDPKTIKDDLLGYGAVKYSEDETIGPEEIRVGDIFGNKKISFADAAEKIKNKFKVTGNKKDRFDEFADESNKIHRLVYLQKLIDMQGDKDEESMIFGKGGKVKKYTDGTKDGSVSGRYYDDILKKLTELEGQNEDTFSSSMQKFGSLNKKLGRSIGASLASNTFFNSLQNPNVRPVVQDTTFIEDSFQNPSLSLIESQVSPIRGSVNSFAQALLSQGVDPGRVSSMLGPAQGRALDAEGSMRTNFILDRVNADRGKYGALRENLVNNRANVVNAENATTANYNQRLSQIGEGVNTFLGRRRELDVGRFRGERSIESEKNRNDINLFRTRADISGNRMKFDDVMSRINKRLERLDLNREKNNFNNRESDFLNMGSMEGIRGGGYDPMSSINSRSIFGINMSDPFDLEVGFGGSEWLPAIYGGKKSIQHATIGSRDLPGHMEPMRSRTPQGVGNRSGLEDYFRSIFESLNNR